MYVYHGSESINHVGDYDRMLYVVACTVNKPRQSSSHLKTCLHVANQSAPSRNHIRLLHRAN